MTTEKQNEHSMQSKNETFYLFYVPLNISFYHIVAYFIIIPGNIFLIAFLIIS